MTIFKFFGLVVFLSLCFSASAQRNTFKNITESDGKIGIGTKTPDELLTVKGTIHTQEVKVDLKGAVAPDYVFEKYFEGKSSLNPEYELISLSDLEQYISTHKHLPNVPSAKDMEKEGISLKKMNLLLLEKVEELTLYILQQQKEINSLKAKMEQE